MHINPWIDAHLYAYFYLYIYLLLYLSSILWVLKNYAFTLIPLIPVPQNKAHLSLFQVLIYDPSPAVRNLILVKLLIITYLLTRRMHIKWFLELKPTSFNWIGFMYWKGSWELGSLSVGSLPILFKNN